MGVAGAQERQEETPRASGGQPCTHLGFNPVRPSPTSDLHDKFVFFKPLSLWLSVKVAKKQTHTMRKRPKNTHDIKEAGTLSDFC